MEQTPRRHPKRSHKLTTDPTKKWCPQCQADVPRESFKHRHDLYCKTCFQAVRRRYYDAKKSRESHIKNTYGLTPEQFDALFASQGNACAICGSLEHSGKNWHIDHDHETGAIRGILCNGCNMVLGGGRDNPKTLVAAAEYLRRHGK